MPGTQEPEVHQPEPVGSQTAEPEVVPLEYVGQWVAWSADGMRIVAVSENLDEAYRLAAEAGEPEPILERPVPSHRL